MNDTVFWHTLLTKHGRGRFLIEPGLEQACLDGFCPQGSPPTVGELLWAILVEHVSQPAGSAKISKAIPSYSRGPGKHRRGFMQIPDPEANLETLELSKGDYNPGF